MKHFQYTLVLLIVFFLPVIVSAQTDPGSDPDVSAASGVPIDGGLSLLIAAGVGLGAKKIRDYNKSKKGTNSF